MPRAKKLEKCPLCKITDLILKNGVKWCSHCDEVCLIRNHDVCRQIMRGEKP